PPVDRGIARLGRWGPSPTPSCGSHCRIARLGRWGPSPTPSCGSHCRIARLGRWGPSPTPSCGSHCARSCLRSPRSPAAARPAGVAGQGGLVSTGWSTVRRLAPYNLGPVACQGPGPLAAPYSCLLVPVWQTPEGRVPARQVHALEPRCRSGDVEAPQHGDDHHVLDDQVVHLDEERRSLHRVQLGVGRRVGPVVLLVSPAGDVPPLPLVRLGRRLPRGELVHEVLRVTNSQLNTTSSAVKGLPSCQVTPRL